MTLTGAPVWGSKWNGKYRLRVWEWKITGNCLFRAGKMGARGLVSRDLALGCLVVMTLNIDPREPNTPPLN